MTRPRILIAGGGIGGLTAALTFEQIGLECVVFETVAELKPLGVGVNLQPNAVRELMELGIGAADLDRIGIPTREWALLSFSGAEIYAEPRGLEAGYRWPQYSVHRGRLQMMLYQKVRERLGPDAVRTGVRVVGYENGPQGATALLMEKDAFRREEGALVIGADGLHSTLRAQMYPDQPPVQWGGAIIWRGVSRAKPIRSGASFTGIGGARHRLVFYPISHPDPETGLADVNWIAEVTVDNSEGVREGDWNRRAAHEDFVHHFEGWDYGWINVPEFLRAAADVWEYPMVDRDPIPSWVDGRVALLGDAAHVMYPTGSNGASQAIVDARVLGARIVEHGATPEALAAYDAQLAGPIGEVVLRNRRAGPFGILDLVEQRCGGVFDNIDDVVSPEERADFMARYRAAAGFGMEYLNDAPPTIPSDARLRGS